MCNPQLIQHAKWLIAVCVLYLRLVLDVQYFKRVSHAVIRETANDTKYEEQDVASLIRHAAHKLGAEAGTHLLCSIEQHSPSAA